MSAIVLLKSLGSYLFGFRLNKWGVSQAEPPRIPLPAGSQIQPVWLSDVLLAREGAAKPALTQSLSQKCPSAGKRWLRQGTGPGGEENPSVCPPGCQGLCGEAKLRVGAEVLCVPAVLPSPAPLAPHPCRPGDESGGRGLQQEIAVAFRLLRPARCERKLPDCRKARGHPRDLSLLLRLPLRSASISRGHCQDGLCQGQRGQE